jgi:hypothetical protein
VAIEFKRQPTKRVMHVSLTSVMEEQIDVADDTHDPYQAIVRRTEQIAFELHVTEEEAQRMLLRRTPV